MSEVRVAELGDIEHIRRLGFLVVPSQMLPTASVDEVANILATEWSASRLAEYIGGRRVVIATAGGQTTGVAIRDEGGSSHFFLAAQAQRGTRGELTTALRELTTPALLAPQPVNEHRIVAAADGSSLRNPGPAGWAWYIDERRWAAGGWPHGTNNMGELMAVLDLLRQTRGFAGELHILCDSQYAIRCCTEWMAGWKRRGWRKADGKPVSNVDLLQQLDDELAGRQVSFEWVKGHAGHRLNEAADERARAAATSFQNGNIPHGGPGFPHREAAHSTARRPQREELCATQEDLFSGV